MTILPQLERDLFNAAQERLLPNAPAPHRRSGSPPSSVRARLGRAAAGLPVILSAAVAIAVAVVAVAVLGRGHQAGQSATGSGPSGGSSRAELIRALGVLRRPQTKADLQGVERLGRLLKANPQLAADLKRWGYPELDRRLARVVNIPAWRAKVLIAPLRSWSSPTSGQKSERAQLELWWTGTAFRLGAVATPGSLIETDHSGGMSLAELLAHGLSTDTTFSGPNHMDGVVHTADGQDGVLLVPDGVASIRLGRATADVPPRVVAEVTPGGLTAKALNAALATVHGTAVVHDNIAAFHLAIPVYTGRLPHWSGPRPRPTYTVWPATVQATWFDARGDVVRRTTTEMGLIVRMPATAPSH